MLIRKANEPEINQIIQWSIFYTKELSMGYMSPNNYMTYELVKNVLSKGGYYLVAERDQNITGWILLGIDNHYYKNESIGFLYELFVFPKYRNFGIGSELMKHALFQLKNMGVRTVQLNVFAGNPARKMYERLGFKEVTSLMEYNY